MAEAYQVKMRRMVELQEAVRRNPSSAEPHSIFGWFLWNEMHDFRGAVRELEAAVQVNPRGIENINQLAILKKNHKEPDEAEALFRRAIETCPTYCRARRNLALLLRDKGLIQEALEFQRDALERDPFDARGWVLLGEILLSQHQHLDARHAFMEAIKVDIMNSVAYESLARYYLEVERNVTLARIHAQNAVACHPHSLAFVMLAEVLLDGYSDAQGALRVLDLALSARDIRPASRDKLRTLRAFAANNQTSHGVPFVHPAPPSTYAIAPFMLVTPLGQVVNITALTAEGTSRFVCRTHTDLPWIKSSVPTAVASLLDMPETALNDLDVVTGAPMLGVRCGTGHEMYLVHRKPYPFGSTWSCDMCAYGIDGTESAVRGTLHCEQCEADICCRCVERLREASGVTAYLKNSASSRTTFVAWSADSGLVQEGDHFAWKPYAADAVASTKWKTVTRGSGDLAVVEVDAATSREWMTLQEWFCRENTATTDITLHEGLHEDVAWAVCDEMAKCFAAAVAILPTAVGTATLHTIWVHTEVTVQGVVNLSHSLQGRLAILRGPSPPPLSWGPLGTALFAPLETVLPTSYVACPTSGFAAGPGEMHPVDAYGIGTIYAALLTGAQPHTQAPLISNKAATFVDVVTAAFALHKGHAPFNVPWLAPFVSPSSLEWIRDALAVEADLRPRTFVDATRQSEPIPRYTVRTRASAKEIEHGTFITAEDMVNLLEVHCLSSADASTDTGSAAAATQKLSMARLWYGLGCTLPVGTTCTLRLRGSDAALEREVVIKVGRLDCFRIAAGGATPWHPSGIASAFEPREGSSSTDEGLSRVGTWSPTDASTIDDVFAADNGMHRMPTSPTLAHDSVWELTGAPTQIAAWLPSRRLLLSAFDSLARATATDAPHTDIAPISSVAWPQRSVLRITPDADSVVSLEAVGRLCGTSVLHVVDPFGRGLLLSLLRHMRNAHTNNATVGQMHSNAVFIALDSHGRPEAQPLSGLPDADWATLARAPPVINVWRFLPWGMQPGPLLGMDVEAPAADFRAGVYDAASDVYAFGAFSLILLLGPQSVQLWHDSVDPALAITNAASAVMPTHVAALLAQCLHPLPPERPSVTDLLATFTPWLTAPASFATDDDDRWQPQSQREFDALAALARQSSLTPERGGGFMPLPVASMVPDSPTGIPRAPSLSAIFNEQIVGGQFDGKTAEVLANAIVKFAHQAPSQTEAERFVGLVQKFRAAVLQAQDAEKAREKSAEAQETLLSWLIRDGPIIKTLWHVEGLSDIIFYSAVLQFFTGASKHRDCESDPCSVRFFGPALQPKKSGKQAADAAPTLHCELRFVLDSHQTRPDNILGAMKTYSSSAFEQRSSPLRFFFQHDNDLKIVGNDKRRGEVCSSDHDLCWFLYRRLRWGRAIENYLFLPESLISLFNSRRPDSDAHSDAWYFSVEAACSLAKLYAPIQQGKQIGAPLRGEGWIPFDDTCLPDVVNQFSQRISKSLCKTSVHVDMYRMLIKVFTTPGCSKIGKLSTQPALAAQLLALQDPVTIPPTTPQLDAKAKGQLMQTEGLLYRELPEFASWAATLLYDALASPPVADPAQLVLLHMCRYFLTDFVNAITVAHLSCTAEAVTVFAPTKECPFGFIPAIPCVDSPRVILEVAHRQEFVAKKLKCLCCGRPAIAHDLFVEVVKTPATVAEWCGWASYCVDSHPLMETLHEGDNCLGHNTAYVPLEGESTRETELARFAKQIIAWEAQYVRHFARVFGAKVYAGPSKSFDTSCDTCDELDAERQCALWLNGSSSSGAATAPTVQEVLSAVREGTAVLMNRRAEELLDIGLRVAKACGWEK